MQAFPKPDAPTPEFWESQKPSMQAAAKKEYERLLSQARKLKNLEIIPRQFRGLPTTYCVAYWIPENDPLRGIKKRAYGLIKNFIKEADAQRFIELARMPAPFPKKEA